MGCESCDPSFNSSFSHYYFKRKRDLPLSYLSESCFPNKMPNNNPLRPQVETRTKFVQWPAARMWNKTVGKAFENLPSVLRGRPGVGGVGGRLSRLGIGRAHGSGGRRGSHGSRAGAGGGESSGTCSGTSCRRRVPRESVDPRVGRRRVRHVHGVRRRLVRENVRRRHPAHVAVWVGGVRGRGSGVPGPARGSIRRGGVLPVVAGG